MAVADVIVLVASSLWGKKASSPNGLLLLLLLLLLVAFLPTTLFQASGDSWNSLRLDVVGVAAEAISACDVGDDLD